MTELLYLKDSYKKDLETRVISAVKRGGIWEIILEETIFYPQGGGQPSDKGEIIGKNGTAHVKHVRLQTDTIIHECAIEGELVEGEKVHCAIDWNLRYYHMRLHSAGHILHEAVMATSAGITPVKGEHSKDAYIEYKGSLPIGNARIIEAKANEIVRRNATLTTEFVTLEELTLRASYIPTHLPKNKPLRILTVDGFAPIPDGGTQVAHAGEVGDISVSTIENSEETVRVHYTIERGKTKEEPQIETSAANLVALLLEVQELALGEIKASNKTADDLRSIYLGNKSEFAGLTRELRNVPTGEKQHVGTLANEVKKTIEAAIAEVAQSATPKDSDKMVDITLPGLKPAIGHYHPTTIVIREMNEIFKHMGFSVADGPEIETDEYNYDRLNLPMDHPARDLQDTLYIEEPLWLLRTHTSSIEAHILETAKPPYRYVIPGKVYRQEKANATNNIMFYQYQGLAVATDITMAELKGTLDTFVRKFFGPTRETRFRCKYYPEVEPGVGVDISCAFCNKKGCTVCKGRGYIEMLGAGMIHPNMLRRVNLDPSVYSGFAWGMGLDRIVMQRYGIEDIRSLYNGDIGYKE